MCAFYRFKSRFSLLGFCGVLFVLQAATSSYTSLTKSKCSSCLEGEWWEPVSVCQGRSSATSNESNRPCRFSFAALGPKAGGTPWTKRRGSAAAQKGAYGAGGPAIVDWGFAHEEHSWALLLQYWRQLKNCPQGECCGC